VYDRHQPVRRAADRDVAVPVGAEQGHAQPGHLGQQQRRRMAVVVVDAHAHHRGLRVHGGEEIRIEVRRSVVRDLEHVRTQVDAGGDEIPLRLHLGVAGQENPNAVDFCAEHER
jgi:hypothetical protein